jgi:catechol 2,3-dioxygenase-like lactoylglutathione lyase family enzyme
VNPRGVHHVNVLVSDVDEAVRFYTEVLGLREAPRPDLGPGAWLQLGDEQVHLSHTAERLEESFQHFAIRVDDVDAAVTEIRAAGWPVDPIPLIPGAGHQAFLRDPSGNLIELNQPE